MDTTNIEISEIVCHLVGITDDAATVAMAEALARCAVDITHENGTPEGTRIAQWCTVVDAVRRFAERANVIPAAVLAEREACAEVLDALAAAEAKSERAANSDGHRTIARAMRKAFADGAFTIRARK
jgi:hypothetical protein